jgi:aminoglycoside phosphotransferase
MPADDPQGRLARLVETEGDVRDLLAASEAELVASDSNDVWRIGQVYLRVCWRGDIGRLEKEAMLGPTLPVELGYPPVLSSGRSDGLSWMLTDVVPGTNLSLQWTSMSRRQRRRALASGAAALRRLHDWTPPPHVLSGLLHAKDEAQDADSIVGAAVNPLPMDRLRSLLEEASRDSKIDTRLSTALADRLDGLAPHDPYGSDEPRVVVHCDLSIANILWRGHDDLSLLDFEWARVGVRDMDLLAFADLPAEELADGPTWIHDSYPELFDYPALLERLWLYELAYALRGLIAWSPSAARIEALRRMADGPPPIAQALAQMRPSG